MRLRGIVPLACLSCLIPATRGWTQRQPVKTETARFGDPTSTGRAFQDAIYGVIKKIDNTTHELVLDKTKFGVDQTYKLNAKTKYVRDGKPGSLAELKVGDPVYVDVRKDKKTGELIAKKVVTGITLTQTP